jgi:D-Tyr-tRNAtyr deacylase
MVHKFLGIPEDPVPDDPRSTIGTLVFSQFTLYADWGRRPFFGDGAAPYQAQPLVRELKTFWETLQLGSGDLRDKLP